MIVLQYIGAILRDYTVETTPFRILTQDGLKNANDTFIHRFEHTGNEYERPDLDLSQSMAVRVSNDDMFYVDNDGFLNKVTMYDYDIVNNSCKIRNEKYPQKVIYNSPLKYWKDYDDNEWIYFLSDVESSFLYRFNIHTGYAEYVMSCDKCFIQDFDEKTGYGLFDFNKLTNNNTVLESFINDTEIDIPNNFYVTALAMKMAMAYKIKQGADITALSAQYNELIHDFYNSQSNDESGLTRISNIYRG